MRVFPKCQTMKGLFIPMYAVVDGLLWCSMV